MLIIYIYESFLLEKNFGLHAGRTNYANLWQYSTHSFKMSVLSVYFTKCNLFPDLQSIFKLLATHLKQ